MYSSENEYYDITAEDIVLLIVDAYGGNISGRTRLLATSYIVCVLCGIDCDFAAGYYGPMSSEICRALDNCVSRGMLSRTETIGRQYCWGYDNAKLHVMYSTICDIDAVLEKRKTNPQQIERVRDTIRATVNGGIDTVSLSVSAKVLMRLLQDADAINSDNVRRHASAYIGDCVTSEHIEQVVSFMSKMDVPF